MTWHHKLQIVENFTFPLRQLSKFCSLFSPRWDLLFPKEITNLNSLENMTEDHCSAVDVLFGQTPSLQSPSTSQPMLEAEKSVVLLIQSGQPSIISLQGRSSLATVLPIAAHISQAFETADWGIPSWAAIFTCLMPLAENDCINAIRAFCQVRCSTHILNVYLLRFRINNSLYVSLFGFRCIII